MYKKHLHFCLCKVRFDRKETGCRDQAAVLDVVDVLLYVGRI
jgi:hypothetical protein